MIGIKTTLKKEFMHYQYRERKTLKAKRRYLKRRKGLIKKRKNKSIKHNFFDFLKKTDFSKNKTKFKILPDANLALLTIPERFSLFSNPNEVIKVCSNIYSLYKDNHVRGIFFDHSKCKELGIGASSLLDVFVLNLDKYKENKKINYILRGQLPKDPNVNSVLHVSGLLKSLDLVDSEIEKQIEESEDVKVLNMIKGGRNTPTMIVDKSSDSGSVSTTIGKYFDECFQNQGLKLTDKGLHLVCQLIAEVIDNCSLHSGQFCQWFALGNYFKMVNENGECNITIFNFGQTIYEGMKQNLTDEKIKDDSLKSEMRKSLEELTSIHMKSNFFSEKWNEELLWTLYAIQDGVSSVRSEKDPDRGNGTVQLISAFQEIGGTLNDFESEMSIISGRSCIKFTEDYKLVDQRKNENESRQIIAFNKENDLRIKPDRRNVSKLDYYFPGTIITMKFYIDRSFISQRKNEV
ncbi:hypothetical protein [Bacillus halotolerans]|uniref:hypothetical protein n=1 Tax=Bacillus halotolerans TaxID=260554 RepID=UPI00240FF732|nr:hypothetical protein [Bacillus halotolerans]MDG3075170.1 hypothetical protein [Bacillus halotolerans]